jgi:hypothetical protein
MNFDEFMDNIEEIHGKRYDELMEERKTEADRERLAQGKWEHDVLMFERAELEEQRNNIGFGSW